MVTNHVVLAFLGLAALQEAAAQTTRGTVIGADRRRIVGAQVMQAGRTLATTDSAGRFAIDAGVSGMLSIRALGYAPLDTNLAPRMAGDSAFVVIMRPVQSLPTVEVLANGKPARYASTGRFDEFYERRSKGFGKFFTREDIDAGHKALIIDLLREIPGVRVIQPRRDVPLSLRFARCTAAKGGLPPVFSAGAAHADQANDLVAVHVDGHQLSSRDAVDFLDGMKAVEVEAMEVYQGPSQLPAEARGNACAAIYIWTRFLPQPPITPK